MKYRYTIQRGTTKITRKHKGLLAGLAIAVLGASAVALPAWAAPSVTNGSFETGTDPGSFTTLSAGDSTSIPGWTVTAGTVDYIGTYWTASNGSRSLDMSGNGPGAIRQTFATVAGHSYTVSFDLAGNPDGGPSVKTLDVDTGGAPTAYNFTVSSQTKSAMGWLPQSYTFTASSSSTSLNFTSLTNTPFGPALDNVALAVNPPTEEKQCKNDGWKEFTNPSFSNQGQCIKWVEAEAHGDLRMSGPSQRIKFHVSNETTEGNDHEKDDENKNSVEYWNFDYPGGLHYSADVTCAFVNPQTDEARFMFQIPDGHPGLSGLYVVAYVKEVSHAPDLYGHAATADQTTAMQWCQTGVGFNPTMYPVTQGHVEIED